MDNSTDRREADEWGKKWSSSQAIEKQKMTFSAIF